MSAAIFDFETIAKHARLKALDGKPQNVVQPMGVETVPLEFNAYGMYADTAPCEVNPETVEWAAGCYVTVGQPIVMNRGVDHTLSVAASSCHTHSMTDWRWSDAEQRWVQDPVGFVAPRQDPA